MKQGFRVNALRCLRSQSGVTILEFIAFIGLAALVIAGALSLYNTGKVNVTSNDLKSDVAAIASSLRARASSANLSATTVVGQMGSISLPSGWNTTANSGEVSDIKGNKIKVENSSDALKITLTPKDSAVISDLSGTVIFGIAGAGSNSTSSVVWDKITL